MPSMEYDDYWLNLARNAAKGDSTCKSRKVGALLLLKNDKTHFTTVSGGKDCLKSVCLREDSESGEDLDNCRGVHAEVKAILRAGERECRGATLYITHSPCGSCARLIGYVGIDTVVFEEIYGDFANTQTILLEYKVKMRRINT